METKSDNPGKAAQSVALGPPAAAAASWAAFSEMQTPRFRPRLAGSKSVFRSPVHSPAWSFITNTDVGEAVVK